MLRLEKIVSNAVLFLLCLMAFLLVFEQQVVIPFWLQPVGRMHPMVLHFPIALIVMLVILDLFQSQLEPASFEKIHKVLLYLTVLSTTASALMGFILSREESYASDLMSLHKWIGVLVSYVVYVLLLTDQKKWTYKATLYSSLVILFFAGHFGAGLTHGVDFVLEPIAKMYKKEITEDTPIFEAFVDPLLEAKCKSCHNHQKHKGGLDMATWELMLKGGENGPILVEGNAAESEMIIRALLPLEDEDHMPPEGKPQLTARELDFLRAWIESGADPQVSMAQLSPTDTLYMLAHQQINEEKEEAQPPGYDFEFASAKVLASLNNPYRAVTQESPGSPALDVNIYVKQAYKDVYLTELEKVKDQIVSLNLSYMPIEDKDLAVVGEFRNLEKLNLNHTEITSQALSHLASCDRLRSLSLSGTQVDAEISDHLEALESMEKVYLWHTGIGHQALIKLQEDHPQINFYIGYDANQDEPIKLTSPRTRNKSKILAEGEKILLEHKLPGVSIRYTTDSTEPDSLSSQLYEGPIEPQAFMKVKALAHKEEWLASDITSFNFFMAGKTPAKAELIYTPDKKYPGKGALSLIDKEKGDITNFTGKTWLGYKDTPFSALVDFGEEPPELHQIVMSYGINMGGYIMPPVNLEIWGGNDQHNMQLLKRMTPPQLKDYQPNEESALEVQFQDSKYRFYKVVGHPLKKLPAWHNGKGEPGWLFVDELFFY